MRRYTLLTLLSCFCFASIAQNKKELTLEDAVLKQFTNLGPERMAQLRWVKGTHAHSYIGKKDEQYYLIKSAPSPTETDTLLSLEELSKALGRPDTLPLKRFPNITWLDPSSFRISDKRKLYHFDLNSRKAELILEYKKGLANLDYEPTQMNLAHTEDNNLSVTLKGSEVLQISNDTNSGILYGHSVHRQEFGIFTGTYWSPKGNYLAFYRMDETMVTDYPIVNIVPKPAEVKTFKYPMAGMASHHVTLGVYDLKTGTITYLKTGEPKEQYLTCVTWGPEEKFIYIALVNRDNDHVKLNKYDARTGELVKTLFEEKDEKYVEPEHELYFLKGKPTEFLWYSERDGFQHLYHYNTEGKLIRQATKGKWEVLQIHSYDQANNLLYITGTDETGTERHLYSVDLNSRNSTRLTTAKGTHVTQISDDHQYFIDTYSAIEVPRTITVKDMIGNVTKSLLKAPNPLADYQAGTTEIFTIKTANDIPLWCRMIKPGNFDESKKYPVLVYVYNGPRAQLVTNRWLAGASLWMHWMAGQGYIIFTVDGRGSAHHGIKFEQAVFRNLGATEMQDQLRGVDYLKTLPYVDSERMAVHGWSYGGFMTTTLMLRAPGTFKVGVAGGPVIDWKFYEVMFTEKYMDTPETNPEGYKESSLLNYVDSLQGKLLLIHGTADPVVVMQHNLAFVKKCVDHGVQIDFFPYPGHPHNVRGKDRVHLMRKVLTYVQDHLE